ncbi:MAG: PIG-L deacetylase family protein [Actinomycetota bacterium]
MSSQEPAGDTAAPEAGPVLAVFAHPDDAEIAAGGTFAKWATAGREVHLLVLTNGDRGSQDRELDRAELAAIRARETVEGARMLGLASATVLDVHDGDLANTEEIRAEVVRAIRRTRPTTVVSCDPTAWFFQAPDASSTYYNHSDHRTAGVVALDAVYPGAGNPHYFSDHLDEGLDPHDVPQVWLAWTLEPNRREDVTGYLETKLAALAEHASQLAEGIRFFEEFLGREASRAGGLIGVVHAAEFRVLDLA